MKKTITIVVDRLEDLPPEMRDGVKEAFKREFVALAIDYDRFVRESGLKGGEASFEKWLAWQELDAL